jgi:hypothetical protein
MGKNYSLLFKNNLRSYSAFAAAFIASANTAIGQIVYTDISPDSTCNADGENYNLDLNNDGTFDFQFRQIFNAAGSSSTPAYNKVGVEAFGSNMIAGSATGAYIYPLALNAGDSIKPSLTWNMGTNQSMGSYWGGPSYTYGNWPGVTNKFIGLKISVGGSTYYGWARLDVATQGTAFTIKDYAYMNAPDQPILAGMMVTGISSEKQQSISIYNDNRNIYINYPGMKSGDLVYIYDASGKEIRTSQMTEQNSIILLDTETPGIYFVRLTNNQHNYTQKIIIN